MLSDLFSTFLELVSTDVLWSGVYFDQPSLQCLSAWVLERKLGCEQSGNVVADEGGGI